jgi:hypothetical protein
MPTPDPGGEEERVGVPAGVAVAEGEPPQPRDGDRPAALVAERAEEGAGRRFEGVDAAVADVADEQGDADRAEAGGRQGEPPGRVERAAGGEAAQQRAAAVVDVHEAVTRETGGPADVGDVEQVVDILDVERGESRREGGVEEGPRAEDRPEALVEHVDAAPADVRGVEEAVPAGQLGEREPGVDRPRGGVIDGHHRVGRIDLGGPAGDRAVLGREQEPARRGSAAPGDEEPGAG